jgi:hypothetical protein
MKCTLTLKLAGERKRARFWSRCCPKVLFRRRRFYSKRLLLGALPLREKLQDYQRVSRASRVAKSHDQTGSARTDPRNAFDFVSMPVGCAMGYQLGGILGHLGHVLSSDLSDDIDIVAKRKDLCRKANCMLSSFFM